MIFTPSLLQEFEQHTKDVVRFNMVDEAKFFVEHIWPEILADQNLSKQSNEINDRLKKLYLVNNILLISSLQDKKIFELCEEGIGIYFTEMIDDIDILTLIRGKLVNIYDIDERDIFKEKIRKALLRNNEVIITTPIAKEDRTVKPSIAEWLINYTGFVGVGKVDSVKMNEYFVSNKNFQRLSEQEKNIIRKLIILYEQLKRSSLDPEGLEERVTLYEDGRLAVFRDGRFEDIDPKIMSRVMEIEKKESQPTELPSTPSYESDLLAAYQGDPKQQQAITKEEENLKAKFGADLIKLRQEFISAMQKKNVNLAIAGLRLLAQNNDLDNFLATDDKLNKFLAATWEKQFGQDYAAQFSKNPKDLKFVRQFLRYVLEERLRLNETEAARIGLQIGNIFVSQGKKGYNKMAYFDVPSKSFKWFE